MSILGEDNNIPENFAPYEDEEFILKEQDIETDYKNSRSKSLDTGSHIKNGWSKLILQAELLKCELSSSLIEFRLNDQEIVVNTLIFNIKYNHSRFPNDNFFHLFHNQLNYKLAKYFVESKITKKNLNQFLSEPIIALWAKKLSYQNTNK